VLAGDNLRVLVLIDADDDDVLSSAARAWPASTPASTTKAANPLKSTLVMDRDPFGWTEEADWVSGLVEACPKGENRASGGGRALDPMLLLSF
jgi:hypothetical protein